MTDFSRVLIGAAVLTLTCVSYGAETGETAVAAPRYTFSWPLDGNTLKPRGGSTRGAPITLDREPSEAWKSLQATGITALERDRRAILAMAGTYRVTFDFLEVVPLSVDPKPNAPYQSWGTEKVYVDQDTGNFISLLHMLEMRVVQDDGTISEPMITKHWRQDWSYQPASIVEYHGRDRWERRKLTASESKGSWVQTVYQVDESPRYAGVGRWNHSASLSTWIGNDTWRPLPRREWSVRDDYQVLLGTNRHSIGPTGWVQEENNLKAVLTENRALDATHPYLAREYGIARYERTRDADFAAADLYFERTRQFWEQVRNDWSNAFAKQGVITLRGPVDKLGLFRPLFERADAIGDNNDYSAAKDETVIHDALKDMGAVK